MKKRTRTALIMAVMFAALLCGRTNAQDIGIRTNALAWAAGGSFNLGVDAGLWKKWTLGVDAIYNPWTLGDGRKTKLWAFQPELRYWTRYRYAGHFAGLHGHYGQYDWGLKKYRYKGSLGGAGLSYGYAWMLGQRWNIEASAGFGLTHLNHMHKYDRRDKRVTYPAGIENKWGLSRLGINITYFIK